jgi:DNA-binding Lrp family transcriptional regulator
MSIKKLDTKDRRILYELDLNARQPSSRIAKKLGLSPEVVNYRIKRLEEEGIITRYNIVLDLTKIGIIQFKVCLSLQHLTSMKLKDIIDKLKEISSVKWIVSCNGNWDIIVSAEVYSIFEVNTTRDSILKLFRGHINKKALAIAVNASVYNRRYFLQDTDMQEKPRIILSDNKKADIDEIDFKILQVLAENARKPSIEIAREIKTTPRTVAYRIKQMIKNKIITGFRIVIDYEKLGIHFYKTFIYFDNHDQERLNSLIRYLEQNNNVIIYGKTVGNWDIEPEFEVFSEAEFNKIIEQIKDNFSDIIKNIEVVTISREHFFTLF